MSDDDTRRRVVDAVIRLVTTRGPDATTVRNVATEAGVSVGAVQYHYRTKEDLLLGAMDAVVARFRDRVGTLVSGQADPRERILAFLTVIACAAPGDESEDRENAIVWTVFAARACVDPRVRDAHSTSWQEAESVLLTLLRDAYGADAVDADDAAGLLALTDGIAVARVAEGRERMPTARAVALLERGLAVLDAREPADPGLGTRRSTRPPARSSRRRPS